MGGGGGTPDPLQLLLARWTIHIGPDRASDVATDLLRRGIEDDDLCLAATLPRDDSDASALLRGCLGRHGLAMTSAEAQWVVAREIAGRMVAGRLELLSGTRELWRLVSEQPTEGSALHLHCSAMERHAGDLHELQNGEWGVSPPDRETHTAEIRADLIEMARAIIEDRVPDRS